MSKEYLEAFKRLNEDDSDYALKQATKDIEIVKQALQRLERIDNAKPSEALKTLEVLDNTISPLLEPILAEYEDDLSDKITANYFALKQALLKAQEQEKENARNEEILQKYYQEGITLDSVRALKQERDNYKRVLDIIKKKRIDIESFYITFIEEEFDYNHYEKYYGTYGLECLTQEEFDLLKRWLG